ncbi:hypothetical protein SERLADRAFT_404839 [Serpula lacrymans var. lacrymans S7.9]|uniref:Fungal-type protein kinase domain-containing protein n=1 Tax=Serpula lacrymans var. lacrymans (strain S7.9) TaxID=578457 RepID=F8NFG8_SERL9|nr:uncharacterized protein SERLADRAFT_404839 [Serpula lacrymans var. lacrymans S7.9]EGO30847.1 hypothetical protein SERLADRAFT_404839 [Serpula lacrymans var. lacrymans S7.9]
MYKVKNMDFSHFVGQLADTALFVLHEQVVKRFYIKLSLCGPMLSLFMRGGNITTLPFDSNRYPELFIRTMIFLCYSQTRWLGYNHAMDYSNEGVPVLRVEQGAATLLCKVVAILFKPTSLLGRAIRVMVVEVSGDGPCAPEDPDHVIIKDCWLTTGTPSDSDIHNKLEDLTRDPFFADYNESSSPIFRHPNNNQPHPFLSFDNIIRSGNPEVDALYDRANTGWDDTHFLLSNSNQRPSPFTIINLYAIYCTSWDTYSGHNQGFQHGYLRCDLIHCDISDGNSWLQVKASLLHFVVPDWPVNISNDMESVFWMLWLIMVNCKGPYSRSCKWYNKGKLQSLTIPGELDRGNDLETREVPDILPDELRPIDEDPEDMVDDYYDCLYDLIPTESEENMAGPSKLSDEDDEEHIEVPHPIAGKMIRMDKTVYEKWRREFGAEDINGDMDMDSNISDGSGNIFALL